MHKALSSRLALLLALCLMLSAALAYAQEGTVTPSEPEPPSEGWILLDEEKIEGTLVELIERLDGGEGAIYLTATEPVFLRDMRANLLSQLSLLPDPDVFPEKDWRVRVTAQQPADSLEDVDLTSFAEEEDDVLVSLYIWAEKPDPKPTVEPTAEPTVEPTAEPTVEPTAEPTVEPTAEPTAEPTTAPTVEPTAEPTAEPTTAPTVEPTAEPTTEPTVKPEPVAISVEADGYVQGEWTAAAPTFTLGGIPEDGEGMSFAAILFDERMEDIDGNVYQPGLDGVCTVRFAILDELGDILSTSEQYTLRVDATAPEVSAQSSDTKSYTLVVTAYDSQSGVSGISLDGGATWEPLADGEEWKYKASGARTIAAGLLQVRDAAGNVWENAEAIELTRIQKNGNGGGGGGTKKSHSSNTSGDDGKTNYVSAPLTSTEEPVATLTLKERTLSLSVLTGGEEVEALFTVSFARWSSLGEDGNIVPASAPHAGEFLEEDDTLLLTAQPIEGLSEDAACEYLWRFDGAFLRTLYSSGVEWLALRLEDNIAVLPTAGFTAGTRFTELKIAGTSSRYFLYEARMQELPELEEGEERALPEGNYTEGCLFELTVDVEELFYQLFPRDGEEMYAENVFCAPIEAMEYPIGAYPPAEEPAAQ